jgi:CBS domain-containing protein
LLHKRYPSKPARWYRSRVEMPRRVEDLVLQDAITIRADYPVKYGDSLMKYFGAECLVVTLEGEPVGMLTDGDIARKVDAKKDDPHLVLVRDVMSEPLYWVESRLPNEEALRIMEEKEVDRLPIIGNLASRPVLLGMLTHKPATQEEEAEAIIS